MNAPIDQAKREVELAELVQRLRNASQRLDFRNRCLVDVDVMDEAADVIESILRAQPQRAEPVAPYAWFKWHRSEDHYSGAIEMDIEYALNDEPHDGPDWRPLFAAAPPARAEAKVEELPELPEPETICLSKNGIGGTWSAKGFTADQMRTYALRAIAESRRTE